MANFDATNGTDNLHGVSGEDNTFTFTAGTANDGDTVDGDTGTDTIIVAAGETVDFRPIGANFTSIEGLSLDGSTAIFDSTQLDGSTGALPTDLAVSGDAADSVPDTIEIHMAAGGLILLSGWSFTDWDADQDRIYVYDDSAGGETFTGSDNANETVTVTGGSDKVTLSGGTNDDVLVIDYSELNGNITTVGNVIGDGGSNHVEFSGVHSFVVTTGTGDDSITTGSGNDVVNTGAGNDTVSTGDGDDTIIISQASDFAPGETIDGGDGFDTLRLDEAATYDFTGHSVGNIDRIDFNQDAGGFHIVLTDAMGLNADSNGDGEVGDIRVTSSVAMTHGVTVDGSALVSYPTINVFASNFGGNDTFSGGSSRADLVSYADDTAGVTVDLDAGTATGAGIGTDTLTSIEFIETGSGDDVVTMGGTSNLDQGHVTTGGGNDTVTVSAGRMQVDMGGGSGDRLIVDYSSSAQDITGDVDQIGKSTGGGQSSSITTTDATDHGFVIIEGGVEHFTITTGSGGDNLTTGAGDDVIRGNGGNDTIDGGGGSNDRAVYSGAWTNYTITSLGGIFTIADTRGGSPDGTDTVKNVENFTFSNGTFTAAQILNHAPSAVQLDGSTIAETAGTGALVGMLSRTDADAALGDTATYSMVDGDNLFAVKSVAGQSFVALQPGSGAHLDFETAPTHTIMVKVTDAHGASRTESLLIHVTDVNEAPSAVHVFADDGTGSSTIAEDASTAAHVKVATIAVIDDGGGTNVLSLTGADQSFFEISGTSLYLKAGTHLDFETKSAYQVAVKATDASVPGSATSATYTLKVGDVSPETVAGTAGNDVLAGGSDKDIIIGGLGRDTMTGGGNADIFEFDTFKDSAKKAKAGDLVTDFVHGSDLIDLSAIDANGKKKGDKAFKFLKHEGADFTHKAGQLAWYQVDKKGGDHDMTYVRGDIDGNGKADFTIAFTGLIDFTKGDFLL